MDLYYFNSDIIFLNEHFYNRQNKKLIIKQNFRL